MFTSDEYVGVNFPHFQWFDFATELRSGDWIARMELLMVLVFCRGWRQTTSEQLIDKCTLSRFRQLPVGNICEFIVSIKSSTGAVESTVHSQPSIKHNYTTVHSYIDKVSTRKLDSTGFARIISHKWFWYKNSIFRDLWREIYTIFREKWWSPTEYEWKWKLWLTYSR